MESGGCSSWGQVKGGLLGKAPLVVVLTGCFSKDQVYLDGILRILRHRHTIDFQLLTSLGKVKGRKAQPALPSLPFRVMVREGLDTWQGRQKETKFW